MAIHEPHTFVDAGEQPGDTCRFCPFPERAVIHHVGEVSKQKIVNTGLEEVTQREATRISREAMFLEIVQAIRKRSSCVRGHVGVIIVRDARIVAMGYNGAPRKMPQCDEVGCDVPGCTCKAKPMPEELRRWVHSEDCASQQGCQRAIHAELNAIAWAARAGTPTEGCHMYSTHSPCKSCAQAIVAAGIAEFTYINEYRAERLDILEDAGVDIAHAL